MSGTVSWWFIGSEMSVMITSNGVRLCRFTQMLISALVLHKAQSFTFSNGWDLQRPRGCATRAHVDPIQQCFKISFSLNVQRELSCTLPNHSTVKYNKQRYHTNGYTGRDCNPQYTGTSSSGPTLLIRHHDRQARHPGSQDLPSRIQKASTSAPREWQQLQLQLSSVQNISQ